MLKINKSLITGLTVGLAALLATSCGGGGSNNDQGVSFSIFGFYQDFEGDQGLTYALMPLSTGSEVGSVSSEEEVDVFAGGEFSPVIGFSNNLIGQAVQVNRVDVSYNIPGAKEQPPSTSLPFSVYLGTTDRGASTIPEGLVGDDSGAFANRSFAQLSVVPAQIFEWMNFNRELLPEPPFDLQVVVTARGRTSAGDVLETNAAGIFVRILPDSNIVPSIGGAPAAS